MRPVDFVKSTTIIDLKPPTHTTAHSSVPPYTPPGTQVVQQLKAECAGLDQQGRARPPQQVASSLQRYLMFAILACIPDRQRTLRELRLGTTLVKDELGRWVDGGAVCRAAMCVGWGRGEAWCGAPGSQH